jgi:hypothetical protein
MEQETNAQVFDRLYGPESAFAREKLDLPGDAMIYMVANRIETIDTSSLFEGEDDENWSSGLMSKDEVVGFIEEKIEHVKVPKGWWLVGMEYMVDGEMKRTQHLVDMSGFKKAA